jgi:hypothetical protein
LAPLKISNLKLKGGNNQSILTPFLVQKIKLFCRYFRKCYTIVTRKFETKTWINSGFLLF